MRGAQAEDRALDFLQRAGLRLLERNVRSRGGELDLVMLDGDTLVVVEVRARGNPRFACAAESVDRRKQMRIVQATGLYLSRCPQHAQRPVRFDVVAFDGHAAPEWIRAAFDAG